MSRRRRAPFHRLRSVLLTIAAAVGVLCLTAVLAGLVLGLRPMIVTSGSMSPTIPAGSLVVAKDTPAADVTVGDVVAVLVGDGRVMHRVVASEQAGSETVLTLQGDANATPDQQPYVVREVGRVVLDVPLVGYPVSWLSTPWGLLGLGVAGCGLLAFAFRPTRSGPGGRRKAVTALAVPATVVAFAAATTQTGAYFTDAGSANFGGLATYTMPKPAAAPTNACTVNNPALGAKTVTTRWVVASPPTSRTFTYTAVLRETGTSLTVTTSSGIASATVSTGLLSLSLGATYHIDVTVSMSGSTWTASSTRAAELGLLGLGWSCGAWS